MAEGKDEGHPREGKDAIWTDCSCKRLPCFPGDRAPTGAAVVLCKCKLKFTVTAVLAPASAAFSLQEPRHTHTAIGLEAYGIRCCFSAISLALVGSLAAAVSVFWHWLDLLSYFLTCLLLHPSIHPLSVAAALKSPSSVTGAQPEQVSSLSSAWRGVRPVTRLHTGKSKHH